VGPRAKKLIQAQVIARRAASMLVAAAVLYSAPARALSPEVSDVEWRVVEIEGAAVEDAGTLVFFRNQLGGKAACNRLFGQFTATPTQGRAFTGIGVSRMHCEGKMEREQALLKALEKMQGYKLDGLVLTLVDAAGKPVVKMQR
ncbi:MAG: META domain-containing protein, partial [Hyphomicrobium sp.]